MKILDKYIIKKLLSTFFVAIALILVIGIIIDISEKIDDFSKPDLTLVTIIKDYYISFVVYYGNLFIPIFAFIASIWVTSKLSTDTEIVAILSSGVSFKRLMKPYIIVASIVFILSLGLSHFLVPEANFKRINFEDKYIKGNKNKRVVRDVYRQVNPNEYIYMREWNPDKLLAKYGFIYTKFKDNKMNYRMSCDNAKWEQDSSKFVIKNYNEKIINNNYTEIIYSGYKKDTSFGFNVKDLVTYSSIASVKETRELSRFIKDEKMRGAENIKTYLVEFHKRTSVPASAFILVFISLVLSYKKKRGGMGINIALGLVMAFSYIFFMRVTDMLAIKGNTTPLLAVWVPNIIFGVVAVFLHKKLVD